MIAGRICGIVSAHEGDMGYYLNALANLPVDENINFYIFVINGRYKEPLYRIVQENFQEIAHSIGGEAVVAMGTDPKAFSDDVARVYFGGTDNVFFEALPAMLVTNTHPKDLTAASMRLVVPLRDAETRFGGWNQFFALLSKFVRGEDDEFLKRFHRKEDLIAAGNKIINIKPGMFGISVNVNELIDRWGKKKAVQKA